MVGRAGRCTPSSSYLDVPPLSINCNMPETHTMLWSVLSSNSSRKSRFGYPKPCTNRSTVLNPVQRRRHAVHRLQTSSDWLLHQICQECRPSRTPSPGLRSRLLINSFNPVQLSSDWLLCHQDQDCEALSHLPDTPQRWGGVLFKTAGCTLSRTPS